MSQSFKPIPLKNYSTGQVTYDRLFPQARESGPCGSSTRVCKGSASVPVVVKSDHIRPKTEILHQAATFLDEYYDGIKQKNSVEHIERWKQVKKEIETRGSYDLTYDELVVGARLAWRNAPRCIGRIHWNTLKVFDARHVRTAKEMFDALLEHFKFAGNNGSLRSAMTVFPQRTEPNRDFRVWNSQLVNFAGYIDGEGTVVGDPINVEFTQICQKLGWKGQGTRFDVLPWVLQADGQDPEWFAIPQELVLLVPLIHPNFPWFEELGLRWYAMPAVTNMLFDVGGIQFPGAPFNGWYMGTEIGARDLCDPQRYNLVEVIAKKMGLNTSNSSTLWKDTVVLEVNKAVLYSYQKQGVTIWDHHTASQSFMQFFSNEMRTRGGCPSDWIWLTPPMSSSLCPVYHQEMAFYFLKPSLEYQVPAWRTHEWLNLAFQKNRLRTLTFKMAAESVLFCASLFKSTIKKRPKVAVLYASGSGKSEKFAFVLKSTLDHLFRVQVNCMIDYEASSLCSERAVVVITSTFGTGEPPTSGIQFHKQLVQMTNGQMRLDNGHGQPKYAVLALGSTAYPNFCAFGKFVDRKIGELGGTSLLPVCCADELNGQERSFHSWLKQVFIALCKELLQMDAPQAAKYIEPVRRTPVAKFQIAKAQVDWATGLNKIHKTSVSLAKVGGKTLITSQNKDRSVLLLRLSTFDSEKLHFHAGDHLAVFPRNSNEVIDELLKKLKNCPNEDAVVLTQVADDQNEIGKIPAVTLRTLLSRFVDLNGPPSQETLRLLAASSANKEHVQQLTSLSEDWDEYDRWVRRRLPTVTKVLNDFGITEVNAATLISTLPLVQPRYFSISSSSAMFPNEVHLTVTLLENKGSLHRHLEPIVTVFKTLERSVDDRGAVHRGLCTCYLSAAKEGEPVACFVRPAPQFRLPTDLSKPVLMIGAGSGIAPFRGFWLERGLQMNPRLRSILKHGTIEISLVEAIKYLTDQRPHHGSDSAVAKCQYGAMYLYYGCREKSLQLYAKEVAVMKDAAVIDEDHIALSRSGKGQVYVQDLLWKSGAHVYQQILSQGAHVYVCGAAAVASQVEDKIKKIIAHFGAVDDAQAHNTFRMMQEEGRYHLDVFG